MELEQKPKCRSLAGESTHHSYNYDCIQLGYTIMDNVTLETDAGIVHVTLGHGHNFLLYYIH